MRSCVRFFIIFFAFLSASVCNSEVRAPLLKARAENLRPTQALIGMAAVRVKAKAIGDMSKSDRMRYLRKHPVPVVVGPGGELYMIDHHHLARALLMSGHHRLFARVLEDWSTLDPAEFWARMEEKKWAYLFDDDGNPIAPSDLPQDVTGLKDDRYRSLAYFAREKGAYKKTSAPFAEFLWARFYRLQLPDYSKTKPTSADLKRAISVSQESESAYLPGSYAQACLALFDSTRPDRRNW